MSAIGDKQENHEEIWKEYYKGLKMAHLNDVRARLSQTAKEEHTHIHKQTEP